ncbi:hypothetical protein OF83DRAFT_1277645 [Amylostereum chailletii]|nr:hypothetical protein OF83DRAFT_1277645 [Amylostereum chailletii]
MAFFSRPASANAAIKIVAPTTQADDAPKASKRLGTILRTSRIHSSHHGRPESTRRECRNIHIFGSCKYENKGLASYSRSSISDNTVSAQPETPQSGRLSQAVNAPVFVPKSGSVPPTSPTPSRAQAQTPLTAYALPSSDSPPHTVYDENDYGANYFYHTPDDEGAYLDHTMAHMQGLDLNGYDIHDPHYDGLQDYYPSQPTFIRQPLNYHLYTLPPPSPPPSHFISSTLRTDLQLRSETLRTAPAPGLNLPEELQGYHSLVPLEPTAGDRRKFGNWYNTVYRATGKDGRGYVLRRVESFRLMQPAAFGPIEQWSHIQNPNIAAVHEAFTTRAFGDHSIVVVYTYYPNAVTLFDAHIKTKAPSFQNGRLQAGPQIVPERTIWSYVIQIAGAIKAVHDQGLAIRMIDVTKVLLTGKNRIRISSCGIADVLTYNPALTSSTTSANGTPTASPVMAALQQEDLAMFGKLIFALCCNNVAAVSNISKSLEVMTNHYSSDLKNVALFLLSTQQIHPLKHIGQVFDMIGSRLLTELDDLQNGVDHLEGELMSELENARLVRLMAKFGFINERPEFARDPRWSETGDRYIIKLFRDYVFHQVDERGNPVINLSHVLTCLNKLDAGTDERILLVSRDEQNVLVVSYKDIKACIESALAELTRR